MTGVIFEIKNYKELSHTYNPVTGKVKNDIVLTASFCSFSNLCENGLSYAPEYSGIPMSLIRPCFSINGHYQEGYVSIILGTYEEEPFDMDFSHFEFNCTGSLIDANGNKRFSQSLAYVFDRGKYSNNENGDHMFGFDRFLKSEMLLNDPDELLPGDCLSICMEIEYVIRFSDSDTESDSLISDDTFVMDSDKQYLNLDSTFGKELRKTSEVFQCASDLPMIESKTRKVYITFEELTTFRRISHILSGAKNLQMSIDTVCDIYTIADKYHIQLVIETCTQILKSLLLIIEDPKFLEHTTEVISKILELNETYGDESLNGTIETYLESKKNFEVTRGNSKNYDLGEHLKKNLVTNWKCDIDKSFEYEMRKWKCDIDKSFEHEMSNSYSESDITKIFSFYFTRIDGEKPNIEIYI